MAGNMDGGGGIASQFKIDIQFYKISRISFCMPPHPQLAVVVVGMLGVVCHVMSMSSNLFTSIRYQ